MSSRLRHTPLALALRSLLLGSTLLAPVLTTPLAQAESRRHDLPAAPLEDSLNRFAQDAGLTLTFDPAMVRGKQAPALHGEFARPVEGLQRLLQGSGLQALQHANGSYSLVPAVEAQGAVELGATNIDSTAQTLNATSEGTGTYAAQATTIFKGAKTLRAIPQSVSVMTRQQMDDQGFTDLEDVYTQLPGARIDGYANRSRILARGFQLATQVDGVPQANQEGMYTLDPAIYDRVEMLRGPAGLLTGSGEPGGVINLVRKRPRDKFALSGNVAYGSWDTARTEADITGPLNETGSLRGRAVAVMQDGEKFYDIAKQRRSLILGAMEYDLTEKDTLGISAVYMEDTDSPDFGLPRYSDGSLPGRKSFVGVSDVKNTSETAELITDYTHAFDNGWQAKATYMYRRERQHDAGVFGVSGMSDEGLAETIANYRKIETQYNSYDLNISGPFSLWGLQHTATLGYNSARTKRFTPDFVSRYFSGADILGNHSWGGWGTSARAGGKEDTEQSGLYGSVNLRIIEPVALVLGARITDFHNKSRTNYTSPWVDGGKESGEFTPYGGLIWDINRNISVYGSYADIFIPQTNVDYNQTTLKPRTGGQYELGIKGSFFDDRLNTSAAVFQVRDQNRAVDDLNPEHICPGQTSLLCSRAAGKVQTRGLELEASGTPIQGWDISGSYTYNRSKYLTDSDPDLVGKSFRPYRTPKHLFKLWTQYDVIGSEHNKSPGSLSVGSGVIAQSAITSTSYGMTYEQGAYAIWSATMSYRINRNLKISFDMDNITDKVYLTELGNDSYYNIYGEPRSYRLKLGYDFD